MQLNSQSFIFVVLLGHMHIRLQNSCKFLHWSIIRMIGTVFKRKVWSLLNREWNWGDTIFFSSHTLVRLMKCAREDPRFCVRQGAGNMCS